MIHTHECVGWEASSQRCYKLFCFPCITIKKSFMCWVFPPTFCVHWWLVFYFLPWKIVSISLHALLNFCYQFLASQLKDHRICKLVSNWVWNVVVLCIVILLVLITSLRIMHQQCSNLVKWNIWNCCTLLVCEMNKGVYEKRTLEIHVTIELRI